MRNKRLMFSFFMAFISVFLMFSALKAINKGIHFQLKRIKIEGNQIYAKDLTSFIGKDLNSIKEEEILEKIKHHPLVKEVKIKKIFPHTLIVKIVERNPLACYKTANGTFTIDSDGNIFLNSCMNGLTMLLESKIPLEFQVNFLKENIKFLQDVEWIQFSSPFFVEVKFRGEKPRVLLPIRKFSKRILLSKEILPLLTGNFSFNYADFRAENKIYLGRQK